MGCASSKQLLVKSGVQNTSERTNATCTDSERTYSERTYCDKANLSAMMTTATGEVAKIETSKPCGRRPPAPRSSKVSPTPSLNAKTSSSENYKHRRECRTNPTIHATSKHQRESGSKPSSSDHSKQRQEDMPILVRRSSKIDRSGKTYPGSSSLELDQNSNHSSRSTSERSAVMFKANCDRQSLAAALDGFELEEFSNHTSTSHYHEDPMICIVRSDKLAFSGAGIRRHSRRKRHRQLGKDNTKIVILREPSFREQAAMAAAEAEAEAATKELQDKCAKQRSERRISRLNSRSGRKSNSIPSPRRITGTNSSRTTNDDKQRSATPDRTPVRSNTVLRAGSSSGVMMFEDKSEDMEMRPLPLTPVQ